MLDTLKQTLKFLHEQFSKFFKSFRELMQFIVRLYNFYKAFHFLKDLFSK